MTIVDEIIDNEIVEKPTTIYGVVYEDKEGKTDTCLIEATSLKNLAVKLLNMQVSHVFEVYTMREISKASGRANKVNKYIKDIKQYRKEKAKPFKAIAQEHEIIIVDKNGKIIDVVFSLTELKKKYPNIKLEFR